MTPVTMEDLYGEMKDALKYLGVRFHDMHNVKVKIEDNKLVFSHWGKSIAIDINERTAA